MPLGFGRKQPEPSQEGSHEDTSGWDALTARFEAAFPGQRERHWKPSDVLLPAQDGVWGVSGYRDDAAWFYVTYGLSDLFDLFTKADPSELGAEEVVWSGFGIELTMRIRSDDAEPPTWPVELLSQLGKYVYKTQAVFEHGHRLDPRGPITGGTPATALTALAFANDPVFEPLDTPLGRVEFITVVGITADELARMKASSTDAVLDVLRDRSPRFVTDPARVN